MKSMYVTTGSMNIIDRAVGMDFLWFNESQWSKNISNFFFIKHGHGQHFTKKVVTFVT